MKKIFSLILALVMALSLTTMAWGAPVDCSAGCSDTTNHVAAVGSNHYTDLQEAIKAAAPSGTVEILRDVTVDKWIMFAETLSIGNGNIITLNINGLTINGNGRTLTVNSIESAGNGNRLFYGAENLNIYDLTITVADGVAGGIGLKSGVIDGVTFNKGCGIFPGDGDITINDCVFNTSNHVIYYEEARDNLVVTNNKFNPAATANVIILYGSETFTGNTISSGRTVNIVSDTATVTGNNFNTRVKLYNEGQTLSGNSFGESAYIDVEDNINSVDVSGNYWGGGEPSATQIPAEIANKVTVGTYNVIVTFDTNGGTMADGVATQTDIVAGDKVTEPTAPTKEGFTFKGWTLNDAAYDFNSAVNGDITLVATWEPVQTDGGDGDDDGNGGTTGDGTNTPTIPNWWPVGGTTTEPDVKSPDTFDGGIALYAGMSVMGAIGAVVLGKKRED